MESRQEIAADAALYVLGQLAPDEQARFEARLQSGCPLCRAEVAAFTETAAAVGVAQSNTLAAPPPSLKARLMDRIAAESGPPPPLVPDHSRMTVVRAADSTWRPGPAPGVAVRFLNRQKTMLVRMEPGAALPVHHHAEAEQCLVLEGSVSSGGVTVAAGDYVYMPAGSTHDELRTEAGCTFLIAYSA